MKKIIVWGLLVILLVTAGALAVYFTTKPKPLDASDIALDTKYYVNGIRNGLYHYADENGMPIADKSEVIRFQEGDTSYATFSDDWRQLRIYFEHQGKNGTELIFVINKITIGEGRVSADVRHIYGGVIHEYKMTATKDNIYLISNAIYDVAIASIEYTPHPVIETNRENTVLISFARNIPQYITEASK